MNIYQFERTSALRSVRIVRICKNLFNNEQNQQNGDCSFLETVKNGDCSFNSSYRITEQGSIFI
jgi:hypothetical protein